MALRLAWPALLLLRFLCFSAQASVPLHDAALAHASDALAHDARPLAGATHSSTPLTPPDHSPPPQGPGSLSAFHLRSLHSPSPPSPPPTALPPRPSSRAYLPVIISAWGRYRGRFIDAWNTVRETTRKGTQWMRFRLNRLPRHKHVAVFSEIAHLEELFGKALDLYEACSETEREQFLNLFAQSVFKNTASILRTQKVGMSKGLTHSYKARKLERLRRIHKYRQPLAEQAVREVKAAFDTLRQLRARAQEYKSSLEASTQTLAGFLQSAGGRRLASVSRNIRVWKLRNPSEDLDLKHPYQIHFVDLLGPGDIARPDPSGPDRDKALKRLAKEWMVTKPEVAVAIVEVFDDAKTALEKLYTQKDIEEATPWWKLKLKWFSNTPSQQSQEAMNQLDRVHQRLLQTIPEDQIELTFDRIAASKAHKKWADRTYSRDHDLLIPFLDPLRPARSPKELGDINRVLGTFGLRTSPAVINDLHQKGKELCEQLKFHYNMAMIAHDFRLEFESMFNGVAQYLVLRHMNRAIRQVKLKGATKTV